MSSFKACQVVTATLLGIVEMCFCFRTTVLARCVSIHSVSYLDANQSRRQVIVHESILRHNHNLERLK